MGFHLIGCATKTALALGRLMLEENVSEAGVHLERALQTFEKLGAQTYLAEC